jgi:hypothetical protein
MVGRDRMQGTLFLDRSVEGAECRFFSYIGERKVPSSWIGEWKEHSDAGFPPLS